MTLPQLTASWGIISVTDVVVNFPPQVIMRRFYLYLRLLAVALAFPAIAVYIAAATLVHPIVAVRNRCRTALRLWMSIVDWIKGIPVGYSYWERYEAPIMLDEIAVHHDE